MWAIICGVFALLWLLLRSGARPNRLAYPCQQAALSTAILTIGAPIVAAIATSRRGIAAVMRTPRGIVAAAVSVALLASAWAFMSRADVYEGPMPTPDGDYRAQVFHVTDCPQDPVGQRFVGLDNLLNLMGSNGVKLYRSANETLVSGPDGIIAADNVVVLKINYQWDQRGGTNTDVLKGMILRLLNHPDTFTGEIVVCENAQFNSVSNFDRYYNNAQNQQQSPHDVVVEFQGQGYNISHYDWTVRRGTLVTEYNTGNMTDGYIRLPYDSTVSGYVSYPKFRTSAGTYISLRYGLWNTTSHTYDREGLKFVNMPTLKSHHATYGATACVKNYMGVVTGSLGTNSHSAIGLGILGKLLAEIQLADLNLLDCVWINANPNDGPWTSYGGATRRDQLVASVDPVAADIWAVTNILIPAFLANGHTPPWPYPTATPDNPNSTFRRYLDRSMNWIIAGGTQVTNDLNQIDLYAWNGMGDADGDSDVDLADFAAFEDCFTGPSAHLPAGCESMDFDADGDVDMHDHGEFQKAFMGGGLF